MFNCSRDSPVAVYSMTQIPTPAPCKSQAEWHIFVIRLWGGDESRISGAAGPSANLYRHSFPLTSKGWIAL